MRKVHSGKKHSLRHYRDNLDQLDREDYCCLVFTTLFNGHYLPWLKQCYTNTVPSNPNPTSGVSTISGSNPSTYQQQFIDRQVTMTSGLELAFPVTYPRRSKLINELASERCFNLKRKLMLTIDDVAICREQSELDDNAAATADDDNDAALGESQPKLNVDRALQVRFLVVDTKTDSDCYQLFNCKTVIKIKENFSIYLELPLLMNNTSTKVFIEFLLIEDPGAAPTDNAQQQPHSGIKEVYNENDNILYTVKECEISGYSGNCKELSVPIVDQDPSKGQLNFRLNLRWELDTNSLMAEVTRPEVVIKYYSGVLLALGTYFWRFYSSLYILMLQHEQTQIEAIKSLNEISFLIGYSNKSKLFSVVLDILANNVVRPLPEPESKSTLASNTGSMTTSATAAATTGPMSPVCDDQCRIFFRVLNISLLWLDTSNTDEQCHVLELLYLDPFRHLLRFQCPRMLRREMIELYRLFLRRLTKILERKRRQYQQSRQYQEQIEAGANAKSSGAIMAKQALERFIGQINLYLEHILNIMIDVTKCSEEILTARKRSQSNDPGDENGIGEVDGAQVQPQPQPQQPEQSLQSRADENDLTSLKLIQTDTIQLFVKYIQTKIHTVKRLKELKQTKRNDNADKVANGEKEDRRGQKEQADGHYLDENEDDDDSDDGDSEPESDQDESDQDEGSEYESDDDADQPTDDENNPVSSSNSSYATTTTSTTSNTGSTVGSSLYETDDYDNPNRNQQSRHNSNNQQNEDKPNNKAKIADSGYEIMAQNSSNYGNRTTAIGSNFGVNSTVEQLMTNFVNCDVQAEAGTESQLPPQSTPPLVDGATDPPPPQQQQQQQQQPESEPVSEVQQPKSKTASIKIRKGASCSSSRFEIDNFQKILSNDLAKKFQSENMFTSEFHRPAGRLIRKIAKQFYRHNLIKDKKVDVVFNRAV